MAVTVIGSGGGTEYLPLTGGTLTGNLQIGKISPTTSGGTVKKFEILNQRTIDEVVNGSSITATVSTANAQFRVRNDSVTDSLNLISLQASNTGTVMRVSSKTAYAEMSIQRGTGNRLTLIADRNGQNYIYNLNTIDDPTCAATKGYVDGCMPSGAIMLFYTGAGADIPEGFKKCDGTDGTPNLSAPTGCIYIMRE